MESKNQIEFDYIDKVIHEPNRLCILLNLYKSYNTDASNLIRKTGLAKNNLAMHLKRLQQGGYVDIQKNSISKTSGTSIILTPKGLNALENYKKTVMKILGNI
jgi:DNA-binding MarR family transcriptional regulator